MGAYSNNGAASNPSAFARAAGKVGAEGTDTCSLLSRISKLPNGIDLSNSVENEFYGLSVMEVFGLPVSKAEISMSEGSSSLSVGTSRG